MIMNNNFKNVVYGMRSCPKTQALPLYFRTISQNPRFTPKSFFTIIFPYIVPKPKLYVYKFLPL